MPAPMSSLRYIVALEIFSKSQRKSPTESFFIGKLFFRPIADPAKFFRAVPCFHSDTLSRPRFFLSPAWEIPLKIFSSGKLIFPPTLQLLHSPPVPTPLTRKHTSATENFSIGEQEEGVGEIADPAAGELLSGPDDVFSPIRCRLRVFFPSPTQISRGDVFKFFPSVHGRYTCMQAHISDGYYSHRGDVFAEPGAGVLGPDVCCTGPLTRKDVSTTEISSGKTSLFAYPAAGKAPFLPRCSHQRGVSVSTHRAKSNASKSPANSRRRRPLKASQGRPKCHSLRIR